MAEMLHFSSQCFSLPGREVYVKHMYKCNDEAVSSVGIWPAQCDPKLTGLAGMPSLCMSSVVKETGESLNLCSAVVLRA